MSYENNSIIYDHMWNVCMLSSEELSSEEDDAKEQLTSGNNGNLGYVHSVMSYLQL